MKRISLPFVIIVACAALLCSCGGRKAIELVLGDITLSKRFLTYDVEIGPEYFLKNLGFLRGNHVPQCVIWTEGPDGQFVSTVYMTKKGALGAWGAGEIQRPTCFPVWAYRRGKETLPGYFMPTRAKPLVDAVTSATPHDSFRVVQVLPAGYAADSISIFVEVNTSYDHNDAYPEKEGKFVRELSYNGQPSVVWSGTLALDTLRKTKKTLAIAGVGSNDGSDGNIRTDLAGITTALKLLERVTVTYQP